MVFSTHEKLSASNNAVVSIGRLWSFTASFVGDDPDHKVTIPICMSIKNSRSLESIRTVVQRSFDIKELLPPNVDLRNERYCIVFVRNEAEMLVRDDDLLKPLFGGPKSAWPQEVRFVEDEDAPTPKATPRIVTNNSAPNTSDGASDAATLESSKRSGPDAYTSGFAPDGAVVEKSLQTPNDGTSANTVSHRILRRADESAWDFRLQGYRFRPTRMSEFVRDVHQLLWRHCTGTVLMNLGNPRSDPAIAKQFASTVDVAIKPGDAILWAQYDREQHAEKLRQFCSGIKAVIDICDGLSGTTHISMAQHQILDAVVALQSRVRGVILRSRVSTFAQTRFLEHIEFPDEHVKHKTATADLPFTPLQRSQSSMHRSESTSAAVLLQQHPYFALSVLGAAHSNGTLRTVVLKRSSRSVMPGFSCVSNCKMNFISWRVPQVLVVEAGSVLPETIEFAAGLRGNDVICAIGHKDPKTVFASQTISAGDLFSRLKIWANSSRLELPIVIARFSELPKHVQAELRMRVGDGWKGVKEMLGDACREHLWRHWRHITTRSARMRSAAAQKIQFMFRGYQARQDFCRHVVDTATASLDRSSNGIEEVLQAAACVHAAKVGKTELTLSLPRTAALGMRLRSIAPKGLISRVHQCLMVSEITDDDGVAAQCGFEEGDIIFGIEGLDYCEAIKTPLEQQSRGEGPNFEVNIADIVEGSQMVARAPGTDDEWFSCIVEHVDNENSLCVVRVLDDLPSELEDFDIWKVPVDDLHFATYHFQQGDLVESSVVAEHLQRWEPVMIAAAQDVALFEVVSCDSRKQKEWHTPASVRPLSFIDEGTAVEARFERGDDWFTGVVKRVNDDDTFYVAYDDGDIEEAVPRHMIRKQPTPPKEKANAIRKSTKAAAALHSYASKLKTEALRPDRVRSFVQQHPLLPLFAEAMRSQENTAFVQVMVARVGHLKSNFEHTFRTPEQLEHVRKGLVTASLNYAALLLGKSKSRKQQLSRNQKARGVRAIRRLQQLFRSQVETRLYFRSVTTTNFRAVMSKPRLRCRHVGFLHRDTMSEELGDHVEKRAQLNSIETLDWTPLKWIWVPKSRRHPRFVVQHVSTVDPSKARSVVSGALDIHMSPALNASLLDSLGDSVMTSGASIVKLPLLGKTVASAELFGCIDASSICEWQKFRILPQKTSVDGVPAVTEIVTSPTSTEWEFEWSSQWRELVAAVGYDIDRFDDDDEAEENAQAIARSPSSVKKAVAAAVEARTRDAFQSRRSKLSRNSRATRSGLELLFEHDIDLDPKFTDDLGRPCRDFPLKQMVTSVVSHVAHFQKDIAGSTDCKAPLLAFSDFLFRLRNRADTKGAVATGTADARRDYTSQNALLFSLLQKAAAFDVDGDGYVSVEDICALLRHSNVLIGGYSLLNAARFAKWEHSHEVSNAAQPSSKDNTTAVSLSEWLDLHEQDSPSQCCSNCIWQFPFAPHHSRASSRPPSAWGALTSSSAASQLSVLNDAQESVDEVLSARGDVGLSDTWNWFRRHLAKPMRRIRKQTMNATKQRVFEVLDGASRKTPAVHRYGRGHGLLASAACLMPSQNSEAFEFLAVRHKYESTGLCNSGQAAMEFLKATAGIPDPTKPNALFSSVEQLLSRAKSHQEQVSHVQHGEWENRKLLSKFAQNALKSNEDPANKLWLRTVNSLTKSERRREQAIKLTRHHWDVARFCVLTSDDASQRMDSSSGTAATQWASRGRLIDGCWGYAPCFVQIEFPRGPDARPSFASDNPAVAAAGFGSVFHRLAFEWVAKAVETLRFADSKRAAIALTRSERATITAASDEADEMIEKAITGFRASVLRVLANRRLWANRFDPLHPGLLLLQNVIRQTGRRRRRGRQSPDEEDSKSSSVSVHEVSSTSATSQETSNEEAADADGDSDDAQERRKQRRLARKTKDEKIRYGALWALLDHPSVLQDASKFTGQPSADPTPHPLELLSHVPSTKLYAAQVLQGANDGFELDLPDGLFERRNFRRAVHNRDAAAAVTAALCRGIVFEREFQDSVVKTLTTECGAAIGRAVDVVPFTMDTAEKVGIKPNGRHFWEGYKGLFTSGGGNGYSNGFEDRHPLYPNAAAHIAASTGGGTHEDDGIAAVNSADFVVFSKQAFQSVVQTLLAGSSIANPKPPTSSPVHTHKSLRRQRSTWQHRRFDLAPLSFDDISVRHSAQTKSEHSKAKDSRRSTSTCVGISLFMDVELVKTWQELLSDAVVAHDIEHCAQQLSQKPGSDSRPKAFDAETYAQTVREIKLDTRSARAAVHLRIWLDPAVHTATRRLFWSNLKYSVVPLSLQKSSLQWLDSAKEEEQARQYRRRQFVATLSQTRQQNVFASNSQGIGSALAIAQTTGQRQTVSYSKRRRLCRKARQAGKSLGSSSASHSSDQDSTSGSDQNSQSNPTTRSSSTKSDEVVSSGKDDSEKQGISMSSDPLDSHRHRATLAQAEFERRRQAKLARARAAYARKQRRRSNFMWNKGDRVLARMVGDETGQGATKGYFPAKILKRLWSDSEPNHNGRRFYLLEYVGPEFENSAPEEVDGADIKALDGADSDSSSSSSSGDDSSEASSVEYWSSIPIGKTFVVFANTETMDPESAVVGKFLGITSDPGEMPMLAAIHFEGTDVDDFHVDVSRLYPCDINDKSAASMKLSRAASSAEAASNAGDVEASAPATRERGLEERREMLRAREAVFVAAKLRHAEQVAQEVLDSTDGADFIDHRAQIAWASDHNALRTVVVEKQSDVSNTQLGLNTADVKELHVTVHDAVVRFCPPTIVLSQVEPSSVLAGHGLSSGDVVVSVNGKLPESIEQFSETVQASPIVRLKVMRMGEEYGPPILDIYRASVRKALIAEVGRKAVLKAKAVFSIENASEIAFLNRGHSLFRANQSANTDPSSLFSFGASPQGAGHIDGSNTDNTVLDGESLSQADNVSVSVHDLESDNSILALGSLGKTPDAKMAEFIDACVRVSEEKTEEILRSPDGEVILQHQAKLQWCWDHDHVRTVVVQRENPRQPLQIDAKITSQVHLEFGELTLHISQPALIVETMQLTSILHEYGIEPGDVILEVEGHAIDTMESFCDTVRNNATLELQVAALHTAPLLQEYTTKVRAAIHARMRHETRVQAQAIFERDHMDETDTSRRSVTKMFHAHDIDASGELDEQELRRSHEDRRPSLRHFIDSQSKDEEERTIDARRAALFAAQSKAEQERREQQRVLQQISDNAAAAAAKARRINRERTVAAIKLQMQVRARIARDRLRAKRAALLEALAEQQRRALWAARQRARENASAVKLQMMARCRAARKALEDRKRRLIEYKAAIRLQANWRGRDVRAPNFRRRRRVRRRQRAERRRRKRELARIARHKERQDKSQGQVTALDDTNDVDASPSSSDSDGPLPVLTVPVTQTSPPCDERRTTSLAALEKALGRHGLQLHAEFFELCSQAELDAVTHRYNTLSIATTESSGTIDVEDSGPGLGGTKTVPLTQAGTPHALLIRKITPTIADTLVGKKIGDSN